MAIINFLLLFFGLVILIMGARISVDQAILIARRYQLSDVFIGVVILAIGSDLPEIVIAVNAALHQLFQGTNTSGLIIGSAIGSNFSQIGLIMGIVGLFGYLTLGKRLVFRNGSVLLGAILYLELAALDNKITRIEGAILVLAFIVYIIMLFSHEQLNQPEQKKFKGSIKKVWGLLLLGLILIIGGSELTVKNTISLADYFGISQSFIAITIIGIGSSLPELAISLGAVLKARGGMSVGNLLGSNIIDTLLPAGLAAMIHPLLVENSLVLMDLPLLLILSLIVLAFLLRRKGLQKIEATLLILFYCFYIGLKFLGY